MKFIISRDHVSSLVSVSSIKQSLTSEQGALLIAQSL